MRSHFAASLFVFKQSLVVAEPQRRRELSAERVLQVQPIELVSLSPLLEISREDFQQPVAIPRGVRLLDHDLQRSVFPLPAPAGPAYM